MARFHMAGFFKIDLGQFLLDHLHSHSAITISQPRSIFHHSNILSEHIQLLINLYNSCFLYCFILMLEKTRLGKCAEEVSSGGKGGGNTVCMQYIAWDKTSVDADFLEELVKTNFISESAAPKKVWMEHPRLQKYSLVSFSSALSKVKNKYQFHMQPPAKKGQQIH